MDKEPNGKLGPVTEGHARQLLRLVHLMNPDINAPEYAENFRLRTEVGASRNTDADGFQTNGALDAVTYYQDKIAWRLIVGKNISVRKLEERINQYARTKCTWCLFATPGRCWNCLTVGQGFAAMRCYIHVSLKLFHQVDSGIVPTKEEILALAKLMEVDIGDEEELTS